MGNISLSKHCHQMFKMKGWGWGGVQRLFSQYDKKTASLTKQLFSVNSCGFPNSSLPRQLSMNDRSFRFHVFIFLQEPPQRHKFQDSQNKSSNAHTHGKFQIFTRMESYNSGKFQVTVQFAYMVVYIFLNS